ncbi:MAG: ABC transporter permease [Chloroflexi bacterium]|nr:ABC transporter permease [Chloroflexota bacterium]
MTSDIGAILAIANRDFVKLLRDPMRIVTSFVFPIFFVGLLGGSLQANLGDSVGYNFLTFTFTGIIAQTLFQSSAQGLISLVDDRESDFSQEMFVSPVSRYSIIFGKILGETLVALVQGLAIVLFGLVIGVPITLPILVALIPASLAACLLGGAFGVLILANLGSRRAAEQVFTFIFFPQFFLAGVFSPIQVLPWYLEIPSRLSPLRYAVDLMRNVFYAGSPEYPKVVLASPAFNLAIMAALFTGFMVVGTFLFVRGERNR